MQLPFKPILYVMGPAPCPECIPVLGLQERATAPLLVLMTIQRLGCGEEGRKNTVGKLISLMKKYGRYCYPTIQLENMHRRTHKRLRVTREGLKRWPWILVPGYQQGDLKTLSSFVENWGKWDSWQVMPSENLSPTGKTWASLNSLAF